MANSPTAGGPPGTRMAGPLWLDTDSAQAASALSPTGLSVLGPFFESNIIASQTNNPFGVAFVGAASAWSSVITMPKSGSIIGMSVNSNGTWSAQAPTIAVRVNNVSKLSINMVTSVTTRTRFTTNLSSYTYVRGDQMKVVYTSATPAPLTRDVTVWVWTT